MLLISCNDRQSTFFRIHISARPLQFLIGRYRLQFTNFPMSHVLLLNAQNYFTSILSSLTIKLFLHTCLLGSRCLRITADTMCQLPFYRVRYRTQLCIMRISIVRDLIESISRHNRYK